MCEREARERSCEWILTSSSFAMALNLAMSTPTALMLFEVGITVRVRVRVQVRVSVRITALTLFEDNHRLNENKGDIHNLITQRCTKGYIHKLTHALRVKHPINRVWRT